MFIGDFYMPDNEWQKSTETFFKEWVDDPDGTFKAVPVYKRRGSDETMTAEEFGAYYKRNETATNHIIVI